jgi:hypothetical protein
MKGGPIKSLKTFEQKVMIWGPFMVAVPKKKKRT